MFLLYLLYLYLYTNNTHYEKRERTINVTGNFACRAFN
jgi:hypothetical protein